MLLCGALGVLLPSEPLKRLCRNAGTGAEEATCGQRRPVGLRTHSQVLASKLCALEPPGELDLQSRLVIL